VSDGELFGTTWPSSQRLCAADLARSNGPRFCSWAAGDELRPHPVGVARRVHVRRELDSHGKLAKVNEWARSCGQPAAHLVMRRPAKSSGPEPRRAGRKALRTGRGVGGGAFFSFRLANLALGRAGRVRTWRLGGGGLAAANYLGGRGCGGYFG